MDSKPYPPELWSSDQMGDYTLILEPDAFKAALDEWKKAVYDPWTFEEPDTPDDIREWCLDDPKTGLYYCISTGLQSCMEWNELNQSWERSDFSKGE